MFPEESFEEVGFEGVWGWQRAWERDVSGELGRERFGWRCEDCGWGYWVRVWEVSYDM